MAAIEFLPARYSEISLSRGSAQKRRRRRRRRLPSSSLRSTRDLNTCCSLARAETLADDDDDDEAFGRSLAACLLYESASQVYYFRVQRLAAPLKVSSSSSVKGKEEEKKNENLNNRLLDTAAPRVGRVAVCRLSLAERSNQGDVATHRHTLESGFSFYFSSLAKWPPLVGRNCKLLAAIISCLMMMTD